MRRTVATDARSFSYPVEQVAEVLLDFAGYSTWWPTSWMIGLVSCSRHHDGQFRLRIRSVGRVFATEIVSATSNRITTRYVDGPHRGTGIWSIRSEQGGSRVEYHIDLEPHGWWLRQLSRLIDFAQLHSRLMPRIFDALETRLKTAANHDSAI